MIKIIIKTIHTLRVFFLVFIIAAFLFEFGLNPVDISKFIGAKIGTAVGMSTSVPENPFNRLALQLKKKEDRLAQKEKELDNREQALNGYTAGHQDVLILVLASGIGVLFVLVSINYYLDYKRRRKEKE